MSGVYWGLAWTLGTQGPEGYRASGVLGAARGVGGHYGVSMGHKGVKGVYLGAGRECRYSGARRGIGGIRGHLGVPKGCWGH